MDILDFNDTIEEETEKVRLGRNHPLDAFFIYYDTFHEISLEQIADYSHSTIMQVKKALEEYIVLDPYYYNLGEERYVLNQEFLQGNLYELEKYTNEMNQKYKGLFQRNLDLIQSILTREPITLSHLLDLKNYWLEQFNVFEIENQIIARHEGYKYQLENTRFNHIIDSFIFRHDLYFWQSDEVEFYQDVIRKLATYFSQYENQIRDQLGYSFLYHDDFNFHTATHSRTILIQTNTKERLKTLLLCASYLLTHELHDQVAIIVNHNHLQLLKRLKKELNIKGNIDCYDQKDYQITNREYQCLMIDDYLNNNLSLLSIKRVVLSSYSLSKSNPMKEIAQYHQGLNISIPMEKLLEVRRYYGLSKDNQFETIRHHVFQERLLMRRYFPFIQMKIPKLIPVILDHLFRTSNNEKTQKKMLEYKANHAIEEILKHKDQLQLLYMDQPLELSGLQRFYKKSEIVYLFDSTIKPVDANVKLIITNQLDYGLMNGINVIYYIGKIKTELIQFINKKIYLYIIQNSIDIIDLQTIYEQQYLMDQLIGDYCLSDELKNIIHQGCYSESYLEKYELNQQYHQIIENTLLIKSSENNEEAELIFQGDHFQIYKKK